MYTPKRRGSTASRKRRAVITPSRSGRPAVSLRTATYSPKNLMVIRRKFDFSGLSEIGHSPSHTPAKTDTLGTTRFVSSRTLEWEPMLNVNRGGNLNDRERDIIDLRGFKLCVTVLNLLDNHQVTVNLAVISGRVSPTGTPNVTNFLRGHDGERVMNFNTFRDNNELHCSAINTDDYHIFTHKRLVLKKQNSNQTDFAIKDWYVPIKKQIRYDTAFETSLNRQFYFVWWCDKQLAPNGDPVTSNTMEMQYKVTTYFREPR